MLTGQKLDAAEIERYRMSIKRMMGIPATANHKSVDDLCNLALKGLRYENAGDLTLDGILKMLNFQEKTTERP